MICKEAIVESNLVEIQWSCLIINGLGGLGKFALDLFAGLPLYVLCDKSSDPCKTHKVL